MNIWSLTFSNFAHLPSVFSEDYELERWSMRNTTGDLSIFEEFLSSGDIVIFHGGTDIDTNLYGQSPHPRTQKPDIKRDIFETNVYALAQQRGAFCYGICRGAQLLNVMNGGSLIQHVPDHFEDDHHTPHKLDDRPFYVNSAHHQGMVVAPGAEVLGSCDGLPEIVWYPETRSFCVQGHPEWLSSEDPFVQFCNNFIKEHL